MNRVGDNLLCTTINKEIVVAFQENCVDFVVTGGLAVSWYCPLRQANDMDLLVNPTAANSERVVRALEQLGCSGAVNDSFATSNVQAPLKHKYFADILTPPHEMTFEEISNDCVFGHLFGLRVRVPSVGALMRLKEVAAERASTEESLKHKNDLALLRSVMATS